MLASCIHRRLLYPCLRPLCIQSVAPVHLIRNHFTRSMATVKDSIPHVVRTAHERRNSGSWSATLSNIEQINSTIRLLRLSLPKEGVRTSPSSREQSNVNTLLYVQMLDSRYEQDVLERRQMSNRFALHPQRMIARLALGKQLCSLHHGDKQ